MKGRFFVERALCLGSLGASFRHGSPPWSGPSKTGPDYHIFGTRNLNLWDRLEVNIQVNWIPQTSSCTKVKFEMSKEGFQYKFVLVRFRQILLSLV